MLWREFATKLIVAEFLIIFVFIIVLRIISGGYSQEMMVVLGHKSSPVRRDIRTLVARRVLRLGRQFLRSCMDSVDKSVDKLGSRAPQPLQLQGFAWGVYRVRVPLLTP